MATSITDVSDVAAVSGDYDGNADISNQPVAPADNKNENKKRKFNPLVAVRKFFKGNKKRSKLKDNEEISIVSMRAKSTSALHRQSVEDYDEEDDGGFLLSRRSLRKNKSRSEDSVLMEQHASKAGFLRKLAYSVEGIDKTLHMSRSGKLSGHGSQQSLNSSDSYEGFPTSGKDWKSSSCAYGDMQENSDAIHGIDLEVVAKTPSLNTDAAKFKISVRPKSRRGSRQHRRNFSGKISTTLPSLNEEQCIGGQEFGDVPQKSASLEPNTSDEIVTSEDIPSLKESDNSSGPPIKYFKDKEDKMLLPGISLPNKPSTEENSLINSTVDIRDNVDLSLKLSPVLKSPVKLPVYDNVFPSFEFAPSDTTNTGTSKLNSVSPELNEAFNRIIKERNSANAEDIDSENVFKDQILELKKSNPEKEQEVKLNIEEMSPVRFNFQNVKTPSTVDTSLNKDYFTEELPTFNLKKDVNTNTIEENIENENVSKGQVLGLEESNPEKETEVKTSKEEISPMNFNYQDDIRHSSFGSDFGEHCKYKKLPNPGEISVSPVWPDTEIRKKKLFTDSASESKISTDIEDSNENLSKKDVKYSMTASESSVIQDQTSIDSSSKHCKIHYSESIPLFDSNFIQQKELLSPRHQTKSLGSEVKSEESESKGQVLETKNKVPEVKSRVPEVKSRVPEVKSRVPEVKSRVPEVKSRVSEVKGRVSEVKSQVPEVKSQVPEVKSQVPEEKGQALETKSQLSQEKSITESLSTPLSSAEPSQFQFDNSNNFETPSKVSGDKTLNAKWLFEKENVSTHTSSEPSWIQMAKKKQAVREKVDANKELDKNVSPKEITAVKSESTKEILTEKKVSIPKMRKEILNVNMKSPSASSEASTSTPTTSGTTVLSFTPSLSYKHCSTTNTMKSIPISTTTNANTTSPIAVTNTTSTVTTVTTISAPTNDSNTSICTGQSTNVSNKLSSHSQTSHKEKMSVTNVSKSLSHKTLVQRPLSAEFTAQQLSTVMTFSQSKSSVQSSNTNMTRAMSVKEISSSRDSDNIILKNIPKRSKSIMDNQSNASLKVVPVNNDGKDLSVCQNNTNRLSALFEAKTSAQTSGVFKEKPIPSTNKPTFGKTPVPVPLLKKSVATTTTTTTTTTTSNVSTANISTPGKETSVQSSTSQKDFSSGKTNSQEESTKEIPKKVGVLNYMKPLESKSVSIKQKPSKEGSEQSQSAGETKPSWKSDVNLKKKDIIEKPVKIEIVPKSEVGKASSVRDQSSDTDTNNEKNQTNTEKCKVEKCSDLNARKSSVLDIVKNFQKLQAT